MAAEQARTYSRAAVLLLMMITITVMGIFIEIILMNNRCNGNNLRLNNDLHIYMNRLYAGYGVHHIDLHVMFRFNIVYPISMLCKPKTIFG